MLEGQQFVVQTGHQSLVHAFTKSGDGWSVRKQCHLSSSAEHSCTIRYLKGSSNNMADALSRSAINTIQIRISYPEIASAQKDDMYLQRLRWENPALMWRDLSINDRETASPIPITRIEKESLQPHSQLAPPIRQIHRPNPVVAVHLVGNESGHQKLGERMPPMPNIKNNWHTGMGIGEFQTTQRRLVHIHIVGTVPPLLGAQVYLHDH
ncbi:uncharacterized protein [Macrobrachium rosenbergii]|uniref:uncharacterized protein n=1 Tax=Macrobrachium rosenbergii TaxID=79674 RepID=UPI0034D57E38